MHPIFFYYRLSNCAGFHGKYDITGCSDVYVPLLLLNYKKTNDLILLSFSENIPKNMWKLNTNYRLSSIKIDDGVDFSTKVIFYGKVYFDWIIFRDSGVQWNNLSMLTSFFALELPDFFLYWYMKDRLYINHPKSI